MNLLSEILTETAARRPNEMAVHSNGKWKTYSQVCSSSTSFANALISFPVSPGDRVAILWENSFEYIAAHFGVFRAGGVEVSLNSDLSPESLVELLNHCEVKALIVSARQLRRIAPSLRLASTVRFYITDAVELPPVLKENGISVLRLGELLGLENQDGKVVGRSADDLASIVYTSGSTGHPKGVMLSHRNLRSNSEAIAGYLGLRADDRMMVVLPFHYIYGRSLLYTHFLSGGSLVLDNRFAFPSVVVKAMDALDVTCFAGVPSTYSILLRKTDFGRRDFPRLRILTQAGGSMAPSIQREIVGAFPDKELFIMYGSTEASPRLTFLKPSLIEEKCGSIGSAIPGVEVIIVDADGKRVAPGEVGEVAARGPNIMLGYWNDLSATSRVIRNGYYYTGDLGYEDSDGCIFLTGRSSDIIKPGGNRVSAKEVEEVILGLPGVEDVAVVGVPDEVLGEAIKAFVVLANAATTEDDLRSGLSSKLPLYKLPSAWAFVDELPKSSSGKVLKRRLLDEAQSIV